MTTTNHRGQIFAILPSTLTRPERLAVLSFIASREVKSSNDLAAFELEAVAGALFSWERSGHLDAQLADILGRRAA